MRTIIAILENLADFSMPTAIAKTRLEALQTGFSQRDSLGLEVFLGAQ